MYTIVMKQIIKDFCRGMYDSMESNPKFVEKYSFDMLYKTVLKAWYALLLKLFTLVLGVIACFLASSKLGISFSLSFWVGVTLFIVWITYDEDLKALMALVKDIDTMNNR